MLSFKFVLDNGLDSEPLLSGMSSEARECALSIIESAGDFLLENRDCSIAAAIHSECLLFRLYDGFDYSFYAPFMLSETADFCAAVRAVADYATREELPLVFIDADGAMAEAISDIFRFVRTEDEGDGSYTVSVQNELMLADGLPTIESDGIMLTNICKNDVFEYFRLSTDPETNKYWGYDYREDNPAPDPEYFYRTMLSERERRVSASFAIRLGGVFIGEAVLQAFDFRGSAEAAIRLLPEYRGRRLGTAALGLLIRAAGELGLKKIGTRILKENIASVAMAAHLMTKISDGGDTVVFSIDL